jgi:hypothetical protein
MAKIKLEIRKETHSEVKFTGSITKLRKRNRASIIQHAG